MRTYPDVLADLEQIRQHMAGQGFTSGRIDDHSLGHEQLFWRRIAPGRLNHLCLTNDRVQIVLTAHWGELRDQHPYMGLSLAIRHETQPDIWTDFQLYSLTAAQILTQLPHLESMLIRAWNATHIDQTEQ